MATSTLERVQQSPPPAPTTGPDRVARLRGWLHEHRASLAWFTPAFVLAGVIQAVNMTGIPQRFDDEGTYVAQAFAVSHLGGLTPYAYFYDHPPLGWIQLSGWFELTGALSRYSSAVMAGREFMLVTTLVSALLLFLLARRLRFSRPAAAGAVALFALSPLAVQFHRSVYLDNIATPWLLGAFLLAMAPRRQLLAYAAAAAAFAIAALSKETYLLFLPFLAWQLWRGADRTTRRYSLSVAAAVLTLVGGSYILLAAVKGELLPSPHRNSLWEGVTFQLVGRGASGSLFDSSSLSSVTLRQWWRLDPVFIVAAPIAALVALRNRRLWPLATALLFLIAFMLRPGYLPVPYVIALLPLGALLITGAVEASLRAARNRRNSVRRRTGIAVTVLLAVAAAAVAGPVWFGQLRGLLQADLDRPMVAATAWIEQNVPTDQRLVVDDAMWVDLVRAGYPRYDVVWYYKVDTDPAVAALAPEGWSDYDYVVTTNSLRTFPNGFPIVAKAISNATEVASFGTGDQQVQVLRVDPAGAQAARAARAAQQAARKAAGAQLATNPGLTFSPAARDLTTGGRVDGRAMTALSGAAAAVGPLTVSDAPLVPGENDVDLPRRQVLISQVDGRALAGDRSAAAGLTDYLKGQPGAFTPASVQLTQDGLLVTWSLTDTGGVLPVGTP